MTGLITKDFCLIKQRKTTLVIFVGLALFMSMYMDASFLVSYLCMMGVIMAVSTISLDEYENGYAFLMTLPIDAKTYAIEKYLFGSIFLALFWVASIVLQIISNTIHHVPFVWKELLAMDLLFIPVFLIFLGIYIPIQIKFGAEKSRIAIFVIFGFVIVVTMMGRTLLTSANIDLQKSMENVFLWLNRIPVAAIAGALAVITLLLVSLSLLISIRIMQRKEY